MTDDLMTRKVRGKHGPLYAVRASRKEQGARLKRHLDQGLIKNMAVAPKIYKHGKRLPVEAENCNGKESTVHKSEARYHKAPQEVPRATKQDSVAATSEWQRKLEAAEALLTLKNSCQPPPDFLSLQQPGSMPGPAGERELPLLVPTCHHRLPPLSHLLDI
ncbi:DMRT-like family C1b [Cricetulus griseus]